MSDERPTILALGLSDELAEGIRQHVAHSCTLSCLDSDSTHDVADAIASQPAAVFISKDWPLSSMDLFAQIGKSRVPIGVFGYGPKPDGRSQVVLSNLGVETWITSDNQDDLDKWIGILVWRWGHQGILHDLFSSMDRALGAGEQARFMGAAFSVLKCYKVGRHLPLLWGLSLMKAGRHDDALASFKKLFKAYPQNLMAAICYIEVLAKLQHWGSVIELSKRLNMALGAQLTALVRYAVWPQIGPERDQIKAVIKANTGVNMVRHMRDAHLQALLKVGRRDEAKDLLERLAGDEGSGLTDYYAGILAQMTKPVAAPHPEPEEPMGTEGLELEDISDPEESGELLDDDGNQDLDEFNLDDGASLEIEDISIEDMSLDVDIEDNASSGATDSAMEMLGEALEGMGMASSRDLAPSLEPVDQAEVVTKIVRLRQPVPQKLPKIKLGLEIKPPEPVRMIQVLNSLKDAWKAELTKREKLQEAQEEHQRSRILFYHPDDSAGPGYAKLYKDAGFEEVLYYWKVDDVVNAVRRHKLLGMVCCFDPQKPDIFALLRELNSMRDVEYIPTLILCPGESAQATFMARIKVEGIYADQIQEIQRSRTKMERMFLEICQEEKLASSSGPLLEYLRVPWLNNQVYWEKELVSRENADRTCKILEKAKGLGFLGKVEDAYNYYTHGNAEKARAALSQVDDSHRGAFIYQLADAYVRSLEASPVEAAESLVEGLTSRDDLSSERYLQAAAVCEYWWGVKALGRLVKHWAQSPEEQRDHTFFYVASRFYHLIEDYKREQELIAYAIELEPLRSDYLLAAAENLLSMKDYKRCMDLLRYVPECPRHDSWMEHLLRIKALSGLRKYDEAQALVDELLVKDPENPVLHEFKRKKLKDVA